VWHGFNIFSSSDPRPTPYKPKTPKNKNKKPKPLVRRGGD